MTFVPLILNTSKPFLRFLKAMTGRFPVSGTEMKLQLTVAFALSDECHGPIPQSTGFRSSSTLAFYELSFSLDRIG